MSRLSNPSRGLVLCYVTDRHGLDGSESREQQEALLLKIGSAAAAGVDWIQIREKDLLGRDCQLLTRQALQVTARSPAGSAVRLLVNDRLDVALSGGAAGVHLGEKSLPLPDSRRLAESRGRKKDFLIGVSCHALEAALSAAGSGADYVFFGPVFATPSKTAFGAPQGLRRLAKVCRAVPIPVLAIGGITLANSSDCLAAGVSGIAAVRLFQDAPDLSAVVQSLRNLTR